MTRSVIEELSDSFDRLNRLNPSNGKLPHGNSGLEVHAYNMVSCKQCATPNSLDSTFCKRCGVTLPEADVSTAREKLEVLLQQGMSAFNEGRIDEALAIGESCLASDPSSLLALSLLADAHARKGEVAVALEYAEKAVELNPESELDKIKRNQLRSQLASSLRVPEPADRRMALVAAFAAILLVVCVGAIVAKVTSGGGESGSVALQASSKETTTAPIGGTEPTNPVQNPTQTQTQTQAVPPPAGGQAPIPGSESPDYVPPVTTTGGDGRTPGTGVPLQPYPGNQLPSPNQVGEVDVVPVRPLEGKIPAGVVVTSSKPTENTSGRRDPDPKPVTDEPEATAAEPDPAVYEIKVSSGGRKKQSFGGSQDVDATPGGVEALSRTATQQYQLGNYGGAAGTFEKALRAGADPISINQRLGQSYEKLGRQSEAAAAYSRAIAAGEAAMASGRGNKDRIQGAVEACRQALRVIQGG